MAIRNNTNGPWVRRLDNPEEFLTKAFIGHLSLPADEYVPGLTLG